VVVHVSMDGPGLGGLINGAEIEAAVRPPDVDDRELSPMSWHSNGGIGSPSRPRWMPKMTGSGRVVKPVQRFRY
jgi:hypothetical protein